MTRRLALGPALALATLVACAQPAPTPPAAPDAVAIRAALEKAEANLMQLVVKQDVAGLANAFTADGVWVLPDATTFTGTAAIEAGAKAFLSTIESFTIESNAIEKVIVVSDSEAVTISRQVSMIKAKGAKKAERHNNPFVDHWKKGADGTWRVAYELNAEGVVPEKKAGTP